MIIQLVSGAVGGNIAGGLFKNLSLGTLGNSIAGIVGGGLGGYILSMLGIGGAEAAGSMDLTGILTSVAGGGVGGGVLLAVVGALKKAFSK
ncbi:MAG: hypothetical protein LGR52_10280 [Candidatus Thiosymbion ectosymbiont of Robbea hypermnestra]|nr:hypothetical protein [Candidatus Thiosymbion ectosymbiont of Robbea hypermnestra]